MKIPNLTYYSNPLISAPKISTDLLWNLSIAFSCLAFIYLTVIFITKRKAANFNSKAKQFKQKLSPMISEFLFLEKEASKDEKANFLYHKVELRQMLKDDFNRRILTEVLLDLRKDIAGEAQEAICQLYLDFGLHKDAYSKLKNWQWQKVCKGIIELTQMNVSDSYGFLCKYIRDPRSIIRKQAEIAIVTLNDKGINYFLDNTRFKISEWQQLKLIEVLKNKKDFQPPAFKAWLTSSNNHVVLFALRLIKQFNQNEAKSSVIELVKHKSNQIRAAAISCIIDFNFTNALDNMKMVFWSSNSNVKILILDAIAQLGTEDDIDFLKLIDKKESNFLVKSKALSSINSIAPESIMPFKGIQKISHYQVPEDIKVEDSKSNEGETELFDEIVNYELDEIDNNQISEQINTNYKSEDDLLPFEQSIDSTELKEEETIEAEEEHEQTSEEIDLHFLPVVVEKEEKLEAYAFDQSETANNLTKEEIEVFFEVVSTESEKVESIESATVVKNKSDFLAEFDIESLYFLPVVVENNEEALSFHEENNLNEIKVTFENVIPLNEPSTDLIFEVNDDVQHTLDDIELDLSNFGIFESPKPFLKYDNDEIKNCKVLYEEVQVDTLIEKKDINQIEIIDIEVIEREAFEELESDDFDALDISFIPLVFENEYPQNTSKEVRENFDLGNIEFDFPKIQTESTNHENIEFQATARQFFNDIEEMGDHREIPFLQDLLSNDDYKPFKTKINLLIKKFENVSNDNSNQEVLKTFNVYEDLFRTCDEESKMILLDEMTVIADKDEFEFLERLKNDDNLQISKKATEVLKVLKAKHEETHKKAEKLPSKDIKPDLLQTNKKNTEATSPSEDAFELNFELDELLASNQISASPKTSEKSYLNSFLNQLNIIFKKNQK